MISKIDILDHNPANLYQAFERTMKTILILAANPRDTAQLRLDEEFREIHGVLGRVGRQDQFLLKQQWAVTSRSVQTAMLDFNPQIVHFSGHGTGDEGLIFEDGTGQYKFGEWYSSQKNQISP